MNINKLGVEFQVSDNPMYRSFWNDGNWESFTYKCVEFYSDTDKTFIDIGAWIGPISLYASYLNKNCHAIEPDSVCYDELSTNIKLNSITNITLHNLAIYETTGKISLGSEELGNSNTRLAASTNSFQIDSLTFSDFISNNNIDISDISLIKIDTEGAELEILRDPFFKENTNIPVHLSVHPKFLKNPQTALNEIFEFVTRFSYFESSDGFINKNIENIKHYGGFYSVMLYN